MTSRTRAFVVLSLSVMVVGVGSGLTAYYVGFPARAYGGVLEALFRGLVAMRVKPYYLHHADLARGTAHFRTGIAAGQRLVRDLRGRISGLCQPTYVLDIPGGHGKVPIAACAVSARGAGCGWTVEDPGGVEHAYPPDPEG